MHFVNLIALGINLYNAGYNMIPQYGWMQALEAVIYTKFARFTK